MVGFGLAWPVYPLFWKTIMAFSGARILVINIQIFNAALNGFDIAWAALGLFQKFLYPSLIGKNHAVKIPFQIRLNLDMLWNNGLLKV